MKYFLAVAVAVLGMAFSSFDAEAAGKCGSSQVYTAKTALTPPSATPVFQTVFSAYTDRSLELVLDRHGPAISGTFERVDEIEWVSGSIFYERRVTSFDGSTPFVLGSCDQRIFGVNLPMLGTYITQANMYGTWRDTILVNGVVVAVVDFTINP